ncbi:MbcA/ParS/Xre antitoxin family protein [Aquimarina sp. ERC-38]|uniref:MbcA/ParS/Xre antitoxin family protein n=1 Tax=Aquimarina sp. ERC-38 TaxID=2949996 RepID=UPI0022465D65|nr:MbcA/ParS/Xre antitoxin family protein [Aquimarina sp. ERC-38]UZO79639.1 MbcA/ParS/Xre antitoxin family protein [Aquimarina sp. ERC-38]
MLAEKKIFNTIPGELDPSWVVSYLNTDQFTSGHVRVLRNKVKTSDKVLSSLLNLAPKTFVSYTKDISKIKIDTKEHILLLISLLKHGSEVFGSEENFSNWLDRKNVFLDNRKPISFLNTISGIRIINDRLIAIEYGDNV